MTEMILNLGRANAKGDLVLTGRNDLKKEIQAKREELRILEKMLAHGGAGIAVYDDTLVTCFHRHKKFKR